MKKLSKLFCIFSSFLMLTACNLINPEGRHEGYEEYFTEEKKYSKFTDINKLNEEIFKKAYFWSNPIDNDNYTCYITSKSHFIYIYKNSKKVMCSFQSGGTLTVEEDEEGKMSAKTDRYVIIDEKGNKTGSNNQVDRSNIEIQKDSSGWLFFFNEKYLVYVTNDYKNFYICEDNTNVFNGINNSTKLMTDDEFLTNALTILGKEERVTLPAPSTGEYEIWAGIDYYNDHPSHYSAYIAGVSPQEYVDVLKENGFTVNRSFEDEFYTFYGKNGGYWYCYDSKMEMKVILKYQDYLYTNNVGKTFGPSKNTVVWFYTIKDAKPKTITKSEETDWSESDKQTMAKWYDGTIDASKIPFPQIAKSYYVPSITMLAHEGLMDGTLKYHSECYNIYDDSPIYFLDGYDQKLEAAGFHKYVPSYDLNDSKQRSEFRNTEDSKYIECFINDVEDIAVKYYYDINQGNTIRVFKKSEMKSWLQDEK